jgi:hypothetical protein
MASNKTSPTILHIRDFVDHIGPDLTWPGKALAIQLQSPLNIPIQLDTQSDNIQPQEITTVIYIFYKTGNSHLYKANIFIYAWGSFLTTITKDEGLQIIVNINSIS